MYLICMSNSCVMSINEVNRFPTYQLVPGAIAAIFVFGWETCNWESISLVSRVRTYSGRHLSPLPTNHLSSDWMVMARGTAFCTFGPLDLWTTTGDSWEVSKQLNPDATFHCPSFGPSFKKKQQQVSRDEAVAGNQRIYKWWSLGECVVVVIQIRVIPQESFRLRVEVNAESLPVWMHVFMYS